MKNSQPPQRDPSRRNREVQRRAVPLSGLIKKLLLPPAGFLWLLLLSFGLAAAGQETAAVGLRILICIALYLLSIPLVAKGLLRLLDRYPPISPDDLPDGAAADAVAAAEAIVILDAGRRQRAREYGGDTVKSLTLERLCYGAWLRRFVDLPILTSGNGAGLLMAAVLENDFGVSVRWTETASRNTHENALRSAQLLQRHNIDRILLITHFWHMPRSVAAFRHAGFDVIPAPMGFLSLDGNDRWGMAWIPSATSFLMSYQAMHELIGWVWYQIRYRYAVGFRQTPFSWAHLSLRQIFRQWPAKPSTSSSRDRATQ